MATQVLIFMEVAMDNINGRGSDLLVIHVRFVLAEEYRLYLAQPPIMDALTICQRESLLHGNTLLP